MDKPMEQKGKQNQPNLSNQPKHPGPDTLFFEVLKGRRIHVVYLNDTSETNGFIDGELIDFDRYGIVLETSEETAHGLMYLFKHALACIYTI
jgi:sRNA-binding regulator protein Hfq